MDQLKQRVDYDKCIDEPFENDISTMVSTMWLDDSSESLNNIVDCVDADLFTAMLGQPFCIFNEQENKTLVADEERTAKIYQALTAMVAAGQIRGGK